MCTDVGQLKPKSGNPMVIIVPKYTKIIAMIVESFGEVTIFKQYKESTNVQTANSTPQADGFGIPV